MFKGIKAISLKNIPNDIISGIIIALVSIPISMGYAQIAGLPAVYGLYGSVLPILLFAIFSSSPQYIFGVDAAPCAVIGGAIASLGIVSGSAEAIKIVPLLTFFTACWLLLFRIVNAGRLTEYVSTPVMGGFISGICATIIFMQIPKLFGGTAATGEIAHLAVSLVSQAKTSFNVYSLLIGVGSIAVILISKKYIPKFPMPVLIMLLSAGLQYLTDFSTKLGVATLPAVERGLGSISLPDFSALSVVKGFGLSLTVAVIIMAETVLAENSFATKNSYKIDDNNEVLAFSICNFASALVGTCPTNGSLSRTSMNEQYGGKSQLVSIVAGLSMALILLFGTDFIQYLPVPVLTAIVICALLGAIEFSLAKKLYKVNKKEFWIFIAAFLGVLVLGTIYGVLIGVILSFVNIIIRESDPPRSFLGVIQGRGGFYSIENNPTARKINGVVLYRFSANLFFANVKEFREDIEASIDDDTKCVIVDAGGITSIDMTGAEMLESLIKILNDKGISFYLCEHIRDVNNQLRRLGLGYIIEEGYARRTISAALRAEGFEKPYPLEITESDINAPNFKEQLLHEFEWAFGDEAQSKIDGFTQEILDNADKLNLDEDDWTELIATMWNGLGSFDEDLLLEALELRVAELSESTGIDEEILARKIEERRERIYQYVKSVDAKAFEKLRAHRHDLMHKLRDKSPELYSALHSYHEEIVNSRKNNSFDDENK